MSAPTVVPQIAGVFQIDYTSGTGTGVPALRDSVTKTRPWDNVQEVPAPRFNEVVTCASTGLTWPANMVNCLRVESRTDGGAQIHRYGNPFSGGLPEGAIAIGATRHYRWYEAIIFPDPLPGADPETHPMQDGLGAGDSNVQHEIWPLGAVYGFGWNQNTGAPYNRCRWNTAPKNTVLRVNLAVTRVDATNFRIVPNVYNVAGVLQAGPSAFLNNNGAGPGTLADDPLFPFTDVTRTAMYNNGFNGLFPAPGVQVQLYYQGGMAISDVGDCGAYGHIGPNVGIIPGEPA